MGKRLDLSGLMSFAMRRRWYTQNMIDLSKAHNGLWLGIFVDTTHS
jgi:hypothetical protein